MRDPKDPQPAPENSDDDWSLPDTEIEAPDFIELDRGIEGDEDVHEG